MNAFFRELRRARVYRISAGYAVVSWLILQLAAIICPALGLPSWTLPATIAVLLCGLTAVLWIGWLQDHRVSSAGDRPATTHTRGHHLLFATLSVIPAVAVAVGFILLRRSDAVGPPKDAIPEQSVAVLPFDNLSDEKSNGYFAEGIQDEILTDLAKVSALKVISRTSVQGFKSGTIRDVREIGRLLGVAYLLEGSVQHSTGRVRVTAQLIDTRKDSHLWAEHFDRDLSDIFAIQTEIAERIVASLRAKLSLDEKSAIRLHPTNDLAAYDLYLRAKERVEGFQETADWRETLDQAVRLLDEAIRRDRGFALAYCLQAKAHDFIYFNRLDPTPMRLALEENAVGEALRLQPNLGEAHLAHALLEFHGHRDFPAARRELALAGSLLPNSAEVYSLTTYLDRREGRWADALISQQRAVSLDPRNSMVLNDQGVLYDMLRLYRDEIRVLDAAMSAAPASVNYFRLIKASAFLAAGQTGAAQTELDRLPKDYDPNGSTTYVRVCAFLYEGRKNEAAAALATYKGNDYSGFNGLMTPRSWLEALVARSMGDMDKARQLLNQTKVRTVANLSASPDDANLLALLGLIDAGLGNKDDALREGRRAVALRSVAADAMEGPGVAVELALNCVWVGESDEAMQWLLTLSNTPGGPDYGQLQFDPVWSPLRGRAEYQAMLARLKPSAVF